MDIRNAVRQLADAQARYRKARLVRSQLYKQIESTPEFIAAQHEIDRNGAIIDDLKKEVRALAQILFEEFHDPHPHPAVHVVNVNLKQQAMIYEDLTAWESPHGEDDGNGVRDPSV